MSVTHGARAELRVREVEYQQARIVRMVGVAWGDLSPTARGLITNLSRIRVQLRLLARWIAEHRPDFVDGTGNLPPIERGGEALDKFDSLPFGHGVDAERES
jgi:hypothetical protein